MKVSDFTLVERSVPHDQKLFDRIKKDVKGKPIKLVVEFLPLFFPLKHYPLSLIVKLPRGIEPCIQFLEQLTTKHPHL